MGTINHKTSDYITLALEPYDFDTYKEDYDDYRISMDEEESTTEEALEAMQRTYEIDMENIEHCLKSHSFCHFHVAIEPGHYESFSIQIENNRKFYFDDYQQKREALKEVSEIKEFLLDCVDCGMVACYPGWCTHYEDREPTKKLINKAYAEMRQEVLSTPCYRTLKRVGELA